MNDTKLSNIPINIRRIILTTLLVITIPLISYFILRKIAWLDPKIYPVTSIGVFWFLCLSLLIDILNRETSKWTKQVYIIFFLIGMMFISPWCVDLISPIPLTIRDYANVAFSVIFGLSAEAGFRLILPTLKRYKNS